MSSLSIGLSGLLVSQRLIAMTGQNIANANTPNYHRQIAELSPRVAGVANGMGVELKRLSRVVDRVMEEAIVRNTFARANVAATLEGLTRLEGNLAPGEGSLHDVLQNFFAAAELLSAQPEDLTQRRMVLALASELTNRLNTTVEDLDRMRTELIAQAETQVARVNSLTEEIARLNQQIHNSAVSGEAPAALLDQRDQTIAQLAEIVEVRAIPQEYEKVNVFVAGLPLVLNSTAVPLDASLDDARLVIHLRSQAHPGSANGSIDINGGALGGILALHNTVLPALRSRFDSFAHALVTQMDRIQATGLGLDGPMTALTSQRIVTNVGQPLASLNLTYPPRAGELSITVTELATGERTLHRLSIDPATQSLSSIAAAISTLPNIQAVVDAQAGTLNLIARPGYSFDFAGNFSNTPDALTITGTAQPTFSGRYTGDGNDALDFRIVGSGTIGATPNLALEVRNGAGALLTSLNIGLGYEAGTSLNVLGVQVHLTSGTVNNGDTFSLDVVADADTAGILPALGLNSFFLGDDASGLRVRPDLLTNPERFALSLSGQPGDGANLARLVELRDQPLMNNQSQSLRQCLEDMIGDVASQAQDMNVRKNAHETLGEQLERQRQSVSGVDPNEELMRLVQHQRMFQMSAQFIAAVNQSFDELFRLF